MAGGTIDHLPPEGSGHGVVGEGGGGGGGGGRRLVRVMLLLMLAAGSLSARVVLDVAEAGLAAVQQAGGAVGVKEQELAVGVGVAAGTVVCAVGGRPRAARLELVIYGVAVGLQVWWGVLGRRIPGVGAWADEWADSAGDGVAERVLKVAAGHALLLACLRVVGP